MEKHGVWSQRLLTKRPKRHPNSVPTPGKLRLALPSPEPGSRVPIDGKVCTHYQSDWEHSPLVAVRSSPTTVLRLLVCYSRSHCVRAIDLPTRLHDLGVSCGAPSEPRVRVFETVFEISLYIHSLQYI